MGHLINPIIFRVGWTKGWQDSFFSDKHSYGEFLHLTYKLRLFLVYIFTLKTLVKKGYMHSHFEFYWTVYGVNINVYMYDGRTEGAWDDFTRWMNIDMRETRRLYRGKRESKFIYIYLALALYRLHIDFNWSKKWSAKAINNLRNYSRVFGENNFAFWKENWPTYIKEANLKKRYDIGTYIRFKGFIYFYYIYSKLKQIKSNKNTLFPGIRTNLDMLKMFMFNIFQIHLHFALIYINEYIGNIFNTLLGNKLHAAYVCLTINYYSVSGDQLTAAFLSRYIGIKLRQRYTLKELCNPIVKELNLLFKVTKFESSTKKEMFFNKHFDLFIQGKGFNKVFKIFVNIMKDIYKYFMHENYNRLNCLINFDLYNKFLFLKNHGRGLARRIIKRTRLSFNKQFIFFLLKKGWLNSNLIRCVYQFINFTKFQSSIPLKSIVNFHTIIVSINYIINSNFELNCIEQRFFMLNKQDRLLTLSIIASNVFLTRIYINFSLKSKKIYNKLNAVKPNQTENLKKRRHLKIYEKQYKVFRGFKMLCSGRFSRKQRATYAWILRGALPLNSLYANIDYGFYTMPILNSSITIKLWLYRGPMYKDFFYKIL